MNNTPQQVTNIAGEKGYLFQFPHTNQDAVASAIASLFKKEGYHLEEGNILRGVYGVGSKKMRLLVGGASKRNRFEFIVYDRGDLTLFEIYKAMSGFSKGGVGKRAMDKEWERILAEVKSLRFQPAQTQVAAPTPPQQPPALDIPEQIEKLGKLKEQGLLTEDEFQSKKQELLSRL